MTGVHQAHPLAWQVKRVVPTVAVPSLLMHARENDVSSIERAQLVRKVRFMLLHDRYHMLTIKNATPAVAEQRIRFFFREHAGMRVRLDCADSITRRAPDDTAVPVSLASKRKLPLYRVDTNSG